MNYFLLFLLLVIFAGIEVQPKDKFNQQNYLAHSQTKCIEGIFVLLVILSHFKNSYITPGQNDTIYFAFQNHMGQNIVTMFLFYSGFGMMSGIERKGLSYVQKIPSKFLKLLIRFAFAVGLYAFLQSLYGNTYPLSRLFLSVIGWSNIGNSNWYVFTMLCIYCCFYLSFLLSYRFFRKNSDYYGAGFLTLLCFVLLLCLRKAGKEPWWYNTIIAFVMGVWYCKIRKIGLYCMRNDTTYYIIFSVIASAYALVSVEKGNRLLLYEIWVVLFAVIVLLISMKISLFSPLLNFLGSHVFSIFILQRIPMIVLSRAGFSKVHPYCSLIIIICFTLILSVLFDWFSDRVLFRQGT